MITPPGTAAEACSLCGTSASKTFAERSGRRLFECSGCGLVFADPAARLSRAECERRYRMHENTFENEGYRRFLLRAIDAAEPFLSRSWKGLDYGSGDGAVLSRILAGRGFSCEDYDPIFRDRPLEACYDFVFSTECFEHFDEPKKEIAKVAGLVRAGGVLAVMTELWNERTDFRTWHYATDPTHVSFYSERTLVHLEKTYGLDRVAADGSRVFVFKKHGETA